MREYCYSEKATLEESYRVYIYVYNPAEKEIDTQSRFNTVNMATEYNEEGEPIVFGNVGLTYLDSTDDKRFYKFKVTDGLALLHQEQDYMQRHNKRRYDIAGLQLLYKYSYYASDAEVGLTYEWTGYGSGCGANANAGTLRCTYTETETISLEPTPTIYRPEGTNGKNDYTQDSLHSVWFSVPNEYMEKYGELYALHATYLNAVLKPILVTGNREAYTALREYQGIDIGRHTDALGYMYMGAHREQGNVMGVNLTEHDFGYGYNVPANWPGNIAVKGFYGEIIPALYGLYYSGSGENSADSFTVPAWRILKDIYSVVPVSVEDCLFGEDPGSDISKSLFSSYDDEFTDIRITRNETYSLTSEKISSTWWEKLWGKNHIEYSHTFDGIEAIKPLASSDFEGTYSEIADRLYIDESDAFSIQAAVTEAKERNETVYLFRYRLSDYISQEATLFKKGSFLGAETWTAVDTDAYFFQETVNLRFEIIDVTFQKRGTLTLIPVVMSPIDVIPSATPPVYTETDTDIDQWWKLLLGLAGLILLIIILAPVLPYIIQGVWFVITLPVKAVVRLVKAFSKEKPK